MFENIKNIDDLRTAILTINVKDYGDFKRKVVLYLNRFLEEQKINAQQRAVIENVIDKVQFQSTTDIERIRSWSIDQLSQIH